MLFTLPVTDPVLIVAIAGAIFLVTPLLMERVRVPGLIGVIVAGMIVGPNGLNLLARDQTIVLLGTVGLLYLMFLAGVEIDIHGFKRYRNRSLLFGALTYLIPQGVGTVVFLVLFDFSLAAAILMGSVFASHTLVSYPIAMRFGIAKNQSVTTAVGGTIITDTIALLVLVVVAASTRGALDAAFWVRLIASLALYVVVVWFGLPRLGRWFFRRLNGGVSSSYLFVFTALFAGSFLAKVAGIEPIVGAFLVGMALNRLIPEQSPLSHRIHAIGESVFIPFFLLSVGMLVDLRVLAGDPRAWQVMAAMTITVSATKLAAAKIAGRLVGYSSAESWTMFGLSVPQAAATLAATLIGVEVGLFGDSELNGAVMMILVTCVLGPWVTERFGRVVALAEEQRPYDPAEAPQRILVPMARPATAEDLMDLALLIRDPDSPEPVYPLTVVPADAGEASQINVTMAEKMLGHAVSHAGAAGVPVIPLTRVDANFATGIARGVMESRASTVVIGWDGKRSARWGIFGSVLDQLLELTRRQVLVTKVGHPLNTTRRVILLIPEGADHTPGFLEALRTVKQLANRLAATIHGYTVATSPELYREHLDSVKPEAPTTTEGVSGWPEVLDVLRQELRPDDLVVVLSARRDAVAWDPALDQLPGQLADLVPESFIIMYPSEVAPSVGAPAAGVAFDRIITSLSAKPFREVLDEMLASELGPEHEHHASIGQALADSIGDFAPEMPPGVMVAHARVTDVNHTRVLLAAGREGIGMPDSPDRVQLVFVVLSPEDEAQEHLDRLAAIVRLVADPEVVAALVEGDSTAAPAVHGPGPASTTASSSAERSSDS